MRCKKGTYCNFCVMCLMAAFVPHRSNKYFHVTASNRIVSRAPYTPLTIITALQSHRFGHSKLSAVQMSSHYVRCAPNAVDDRSRNHHAERSSVLGTCFWPIIVRQDAPIVPSIADTAQPPAAVPYPRERFSPLTIAEVVGFKGERLKPSYRSETPLDARRLPTFN